jgi:hypothetical protein
MAKPKFFSLLMFAPAAFLLSASTGQAMEFAAVPIGVECSPTHCPRAIVAEGEITRQSPENFARFLRAQIQVPGLHGVVFLNSPGGNVESSLKLGSILHESGVAVVVGRPAVSNRGRVSRHARSEGQTGAAQGDLAVVPGQCASACVYTLMGAKKRVVPQGARLGVHRMSAKMTIFNPVEGDKSSDRVFAGPSEIEALRSYVASVGGSQELISLAESIPHDRIKVLSAAEIRKYRLGVGKL